MFSFDKIQLLINHRRYQDAEREIRMALATEPMNANLHMLLAICLVNEPTRLDEAKTEAQQAVGLEPDEPSFHYVLAVVLKERKEYAEARKYFRSSLSLDPTMARSWSGLAHLELLESNWQAALDTVEKCLQIDPDNTEARNFRTIALERLGRGREALNSARESLREAPDDATSHAAAGWAALNNGKHEEAQIHFREALRLNPNDEFAKSGMVSALCSRYVFFRLFYRFNVWLSRFAAKYQFLIFLAILFLPRVLGQFANTENGLGIMVLVVRGALLSIIVLTWLIEPLTHLALRFNSFGKYLLSAKEIWCSNLIASYVAASIVGLIYGFIRCPGWLPVIVPFYWLICVFVTTIAFQQPNVWRMRLVGAIAVVIALLPAYGLLSAYNAKDLTPALDYFRMAGSAAFIGQILHAIDSVRNPRS
jgi:Flp pilus assembly protein TadD